MRVILIVIEILHSFSLAAGSCRGSQEHIRIESLLRKCEIACFFTKKRKFYCLCLFCATLFKTKTDYYVLQQNVQHRSHMSAKLELTLASFFTQVLPEKGNSIIALSFSIPTSKLRMNCLGFRIGLTATKQNCSIFAI